MPDEEAVANVSKVGAPSDVALERLVGMVMGLLSDSVMSGKVEGLVMSDDLVD